MFPMPLPIFPTHGLILDVFKVACVPEPFSTMCSHSNICSGQSSSTQLQSQSSTAQRLAPKPSFQLWFFTPT